MLNVANWTDKQLDELTDLLHSADHSLIAAFVFENFLASGSRIMVDEAQSQLRVTVNTADHKAVDLSPGVFLHQLLCSQIDSSQTINILATATGAWGTTGHPEAGKPATGNRWTIICIRNANQYHTDEQRWFVDDSVVPNAYSEHSVPTLINKAYYDIYVRHGADGAAVPNAPSGYWTVAEIYIPVGCLDLTDPGVIIKDTFGTSGHAPPNWNEYTRIPRLEFQRGFPTNTKIPFFQASAPPGWVKVTGYDDSALRVVDGSGGVAGGSVGVSTLSGVTVGPHTLTIPEMPIHFHSYTFTNAAGGRGGDRSQRTQENTFEGRNTGSTGGDQPHTHPMASVAIKYVDVIICRKT